MASLVIGLLSAVSAAARAALRARARRLYDSGAAAERYLASSGPDRRW